MNEFEAYDYAVKQQKTPAVRLWRFLLVVGYVLFAAVMMVLGAVTRLGAPIVALTPFALALLVFFTWRYTSVEFECAFASGEVTVSKIYGGRTRRELVTFRLRDCTMIAPASDRFAVEKAELFRPQHTYNALSSADAPDAYLATFETEDGMRGLVRFEATQKALRICHFYNAAATTLTKVSK